MDKQMLQQQVQNLTDLVEYFTDTMTQSVDDLINRLKLDLDLFAEGQHIGPKLHGTPKDVYWIG